MEYVQSMHSDCSTQSIQHSLSSLAPLKKRAFPAESDTHKTTISKSSSSGKISVLAFDPSKIPAAKKTCSIPYVDNQDPLSVSQILLSFSSKNVSASNDVESSSSHDESFKFELSYGRDNDHDIQRSGTAQDNRKRNIDTTFDITQTPEYYFSQYVSLAEKYFKKATDGCICQLCNTEIIPYKQDAKGNDNTAKGLWAHLRRKHPEIYSSSNKELLKLRPKPCKYPSDHGNVSLVSSYFIRVDDMYYACKMCEHKIKRRFEAKRCNSEKTTTEFWRHLKRSHLEIYVDSRKALCEKKGQRFDPHSISTKSANTGLKSKRSRKKTQQDDAPPISLDSNVFRSGQSHLPTVGIPTATTKLLPNLQFHEPEVVTSTSNIFHSTIPHTSNVFNIPNTTDTMTNWSTDQIDYFEEAEEAVDNLADDEDDDSPQMSIRLTQQPSPKITTVWPTTTMTIQNSSKSSQSIAQTEAQSIAQTEAQSIAQTEAQSIVQTEMDIWPPPASVKHQGVKFGTMKDSGGPDKRSKVELQKAKAEHWAKYVAIAESHFLKAGHGCICNLCGEVLKYKCTPTGDDETVYGLWRHLRYKHTEEHAAAQKTLNPYRPQSRTYGGAYGNSDDHGNTSVVSQYFVLKDEETYTCRVHNCGVPIKRRFEAKRGNVEKTTTEFWRHLKRKHQDLHDACKLTLAETRAKNKEKRSKSESVQQLMPYEDYIALSGSGTKEPIH